METLTTKVEIANEFEETGMFCGPDESTDTPRPDGNDDTTGSKKDEDDKTDQDGEVIKPGGF
ncbi:hypothetical protein [Kordia sp.]|uniref:hypothetical protein n=1 Tax=Kordia sp. TaxID=1965332 RepID=UPI003D2781BA